MGEYSRTSSFSIVFHDEAVPMHFITSQVYKALGTAFDAECVDFARAAQPDGSTSLSFTYHLEPSSSGLDSPATILSNPERVRIHCDLLDDLDVNQDANAVSVALDRHWTEHHRRMVGEAADPATVQAWREERKFRATLAATPLPFRSRASSLSAERVSAGLRRHHAIRVNASGSTVRMGFDRAIADIDKVNSGAHACYAKPSTPIPHFSYDEFLQECLRMRQGNLRSQRPSRQSPRIQTENPARRANREG